MPRIRSAAFSATITTAALVLPPTMRGNTDASTTRKTLDTVHAQGGIDDGVGVGPHAATADRVMNRVRRAAHVGGERRLVLLRGTRLDFDARGSARRRAPR